MLPELAERNWNSLILLSLRATEGSVAISKIKIFFGDHHVASLLVMTDYIGNSGHAGSIEQSYSLCYSEWAEDYRNG
jgi:hypothetical protein